MTPEITTEELVAILAAKSEPVFDVRSAKEYAIGHIPGTINVSEREVQRISELYPDRDTRMILYCNGPSCGKSKRTSEQLVALGYTRVRRYQLGISVWRALSHTVQTDLPGFDYIYTGDRTAVFVDARTPAEYARGTVSGAVNIQKGEAAAANDDGRLPLDRQRHAHRRLRQDGRAIESRGHRDCREGVLELQLFRRHVRRSGRRPLPQTNGASGSDGPAPLIRVD